MYRLFLFLLATFFVISFSYSQTYNQMAIYTPDIIIDNTQFGEKMSISGDYLAVAAPYESKVYVFKKTEQQWQQVAELTPSDINEAEKFGNDVDIYGDVIVIGASESSIVYVYQKPVDGWTDMTETAKLARELTEDEIFSGFWQTEYFGESVAIYENTIVIGAYKFRSEDHVLCGKVFVFEKPETGWTDMSETASLTVTDEADNQVLGRAVDIYGDIIVAGEGRMTVNSSAYLFQRTSNSWSSMTETAKFTPENPQLTFGSDISIENDVVVIGGKMAQGEEIGTGAVYVFEKPIDGWVSTNETAFLTQNSGMNGDYFGISVSISGNFIIVGASGAYDYEHIIDTGLAYVFEKSSEGWNDMTETARLYPVGANAYDEFGCAVVNTEDEILVGARSLNYVTGRSGAFYQYNYKFEPQDISLSYNEIEECSKLNKTIGGFSAIDGNRYDIHTYELISNGENNYDNDAFVIIDDSLCNNTNLDYEQKNNYAIYVEVTDSTELSYAKEFEIIINNIKPLLSDTNFVVAKFASENTFVGDIDCKGDTNSVSFEIQYNNYGNAFKIENANGRLYVNNSDALNPDTYSQFDLNIRVYDGIYGNEATALIEYKSPTSTDDITKADFTVYPNPSTQAVIIKFYRKNIELPLNIINTAGRVVLSKIVSDNEQINVKQLPAGLYFIKVGTSTQKLIINK